MIDILSRRKWKQKACEAAGDRGTSDLDPSWAEAMRIGRQSRYLGKNSSLCADGECETFRLLPPSGSSPRKAGIPGVDSNHRVVMHFLFCDGNHSLSSVGDRINILTPPSMKGMMTSRTSTIHKGEIIRENVFSQGTPHANKQEDDGVNLSLICEFESD